MSITSFSAPIVKDEKSGWTCVLWEGSVGALGTGKAVKVSCCVDAVEFDVTLMSVGGKHMLPLKAEIRRKLGKNIGDQVDVTILNCL